MSLFRTLHTHFQVNINKTCFLCSEGILHILGDANKKQHDENAHNSCMSITVLCCGSAAGTHGPVIFILKGSSRVNKMFTKEGLQTKLGLPEGSCVLLHGSAYMDNVTWVRVVNELAPALQKMPVVKDHPDWWLLLTYNGFKSHVNVTEALEKFHMHKIRVVKEEAGTSHVNQAYNQAQA